MKNTVIFFVVLCTILVKVKCRLNIGALIDNTGICMKELGLTKDQVLNSQGDTACFEFCMMKRLDVIKDNQVNIQKFQEVIKFIKPKREAQLIVSATRQCTEIIPVLEDNCESFTQIKNCVHEKIQKK